MIFPAFHNYGNLGDSSSLHREYNYKLCTAIDLTKLGCVLDEMIKSRHLSVRMAYIYRSQADALLAALRSENNRNFAEQKDEE